MSQKNNDITPDLIESVDSLLDEIEETTKIYTPKEEKGFDSNALVTDDGTIAPPPEPKAEPPKSEAPPEPEPSESIDSAQDALDAIEEVEIQAEDLVAQSIGALLDEAESTAESIQDSDHVDEHADSELATDEVVEDLVEETIEDTAEEIDARDLLASIDDLLQTADETESPTEPDADQEADLIEPKQDEVVSEQTQESATQAPTTQPDSDQVEESNTETTLDPDPEAVQETETADAFDESMDMLDSALSEAADDMLDGDFETEDGELVSGEAVASAIEEALEAQPKPENKDAVESEDQGEDENESESLAGLADELLSPSAPDQPGPDTQTTDDNTASQESETKETSEVSPSPNSTPAPESAPESVASVPSNTSAEQTVQTVAEDASAKQADAPTTPMQDPDVQSEIDALKNQDATGPVPIPAWFERCVEVVRPKIDKIDPFKGKTMDALAMALGTAIVTVITHTTPLLARGTILLSKPLAKQSPEIRNAIGFVALWTGFLGVVLWSYLLLFRTPTTPQPEVAPTRVISAEESLIVNPAINVLP